MGYSAIWFAYKVHVYALTVVCVYTASEKYKICAYYM